MTEPERFRAVALLSGGLDSGVALALWLESGHAVELCLCADYGQRAHARELAASRALASRYGVQHRALALTDLALASARSGNALDRSATVDLPRGSLAQPGDGASAAAVWVPARNVVLLAMAASFAEALGATHVLVGFNREEAATFPDNSAEFCADFDRVLARGTRNGVRVASPTLWLDKPAMTRQALRLGLAAGDFWSCYGDGRDGECCTCESCLRSRRAWSAAMRDGPAPAPPRFHELT